MKQASIEYQKLNWTYIIECEDHSYYSGYTTDPVRRFNEHISGKGAKYTKAFKPVKMVALYAMRSKSDAMKFEAALKKLGHKGKQLVISGNGYLLNRLSTKVIIGQNLIKYPKTLKDQYLIDISKLRV